ncbi:putative RNA-directed DNA polymerase [Helianthus annuus]|nr:putative RNA-directed DNA polymerase [Helianthus annuus]KAJ0506760.1 putative RNA-directed DNA polymerase [Helianthus annuus]KAJ0676439.1 putative RNA-directed DNA polymerase [Helianthus annuus]KAJ0679650.1 putative RNA-directed DNA polymerase [Helianthus annuus]
MDGPLVLNEILSWAKKNKRKGMYFKVDINKAYDSVNWAFLDSIMAQMKFPSKWRGWVMATLQSARASVLVNGSPTREFDCSRGLRQGDPLSPFLFVIVMEALSGIMKKAVSVGLFNGIKISNEGTSLSHLMYADDVIFIGDWSLSNIFNLRRVLRCYYLVSGLRVNLEKCSIFGFGVEASIKKTLSSVNRVRPGKAFEWNNWVPKKVGIVAWRAEMERLPTRCALAARSIPVNDRTCIMCGSYDESSEHLLVSCQFAQMVWQNIALWCSIPPIIAFDLKDMLTLHEVCTVSGKKKKVLHAVILVAIWSIWKSRNEAVFQQKSPNMTKTLDEIKAMAYLWVKNRSRSMTLTWEDWSKFKI